MKNIKLRNKKTKSEALFEEYLTTHGYTDWIHECAMPGKPTTPDYRVRFDGKEIFFEVKEFDSPMPPSSPGVFTFDGYGPIRVKIERARKQFKPYKDNPCALVLANPNGAFVMIEEPWAILGAMLGNLGVAIPVGPSVPADAAARQVYLGGGKMRPAKRAKPQNTTISAIITLCYYPVHERLRLTRLHVEATKRGRALTCEELSEVMNECRDAEPVRALRVKVFENLDARVPLPTSVFTGPFDERWARDGQYIRKTFQGKRLALIESEFSEAKRNSPLS